MKKIHLLLQNDNKYYIFCSVYQSSDGSLVCAFPNLNSTQQGASQLLQTVRLEDGSYRTELIKTNSHKQIFPPDLHVSYHTTGRVNYRETTFDPQFLEPLYAITRPNLFFIIYFHSMITFKEAPDSSLKRTGTIILDVTPLLSTGCDILFSIVPHGFLHENQHEQRSAISINYDLYDLLIDVVNDTATFKFGDCAKTNGAVKMRPWIDFYDTQFVSKQAAYLTYQHVLYKTDELILKGPNGEGIIEAVFPVEMYRAPWLSITFVDANLIIDPGSIDRNETRIRFKVVNIKTRQIVKNPEDLLIKEMVLDAEIYDDETSPPPGFFNLSSSYIFLSNDGKTLFMPSIDLLFSIC